MLCKFVDFNVLKAQFSAVSRFISINCVTIELYDTYLLGDKYLLQQQTTRTKSDF